MAQKQDLIYQVFVLFLTVTLLLSSFLFFRSIYLQDKSINTWEFPMLLALLFDNVYTNYY